MSTHINDTTVLGASDGGLTNHAVLVKVKNVAELVRAQGAVASLAQAVAPASIESKVYATLKDELKTALKDKGVDADISVVDPANYVSAGWDHLGTDLGLAIGGAGIGALIYWLFTRHRK